MTTFKYILLSFFSLIFYCAPIFSKHFILIGRAGSGKGAFANYMAKKYNYIHIGAGDLYRERNDNHLSVDINSLTKIMKKRILLAITNKQKFILDNAIYNWSSWKSWRSFFNKHNLTQDICFIVLEASDQTCLDRIKHRVICKKCFNVCTELTKLSLQEQKCSECGNNLSIRSRDRDDARSRLRFYYYHLQTTPLIRSIEESKEYTVIRISSEKDLEELYTIYDKLNNL
jgi:adenylate kinase family enzyme